MASPGMDLKGVTQEEISKLTKAMRSEEFKGHMDEYCKEISDPAHRKEYLQYLDQLEAKGEMPEGQQLLRCQPGCCVKTWICFKNGQTQKCFINIVHSERLDDVQMERTDKGDGHQVKLPYSLSPPRPDRDLKGEYCMTCDFAVSSRTFFQAMQYPNYLKMLVDTATENLASHHLKGNEEVKKDYKVMQKMACKGGVPMPMSVRAEMLRDKGTKPTTPKVKAGMDAVTPSELRQMRKDAKQKKSDQEQEDDEPAPQARAAAPEKAAAAPRIRVPQHRLVHSGTLDLTDYMESKNQISTAPPSIPRVLKLTVEVPTVKRVGDINLEVTSTNVVVEVPEKYYLDLPLPYEVQDSNGSAKFDKAKQVLTLELPVVPKPQTLNPNFSWRGDDAAAGGDHDGALSEGNGESDEDMPVLEEVERPAATPAEAPEPAAARTAAADGGVPAQPAAAAAADPPRQRLELGPQGGSLHFARPGEEPAEGVGEEAEPEEDCPAFVAAEAFEGARPGYYFGMGDDGLGYHLDKRQKRPGRARQQREVLIPGAPAGGSRGQPAAGSSEPLVSEVADRPASGGAAAAASGGSSAASTAAAGGAKQEAEPARRLPSDLQRYVDATTALASRADSGSATKAGEEPAVEWEQTLQNLMLLVDLPSGHEVSDLQLVVRGQRLTLAFCTGEPAGAEGGEPRRQRWQLRRLLCGMVDPRQWHAEPPIAPGEPLIIVIRKVDRGTWPEIFDAKATLAPEPVEAPRTAVAIGAGDAEPAAASADGGSPALNEQDSGAVPAGGEARPNDAEDAPLEDSAELDAAAPAADEAPGIGAKAVAESGSRAGVPKGPAAEALIQSAVVMGQGVLLRSRLMYELL